MRRTHTTRTLITIAIVGALLAGSPARAAAQQAPPDTKTSADISREIRDALRTAGRDVGEAIREVSRELSREFGHGGEQNDRNWNGRAEDRQTHALAIGPNGSIELRNLSGDVTVTAGTGRDASIEVIRRSRGRTDADARLGLERVKVDQQVAGTRAAIKTDYANDRQSAYNVSVEMIVTAPVGTRVLINSVSANVKVTGIHGELAVKTISGDVTLANVGVVTDAKTASGNVTITGAAGDGALEVEAISGDLTLKQVKARSIKANTVSGNISASDITCETATFNALSGDASFAGDVAKNGRYEITSHSGDVHFTPTGPAGYSLSASSFGGDIHPPAGFQHDATGSKRRRTVSGKVGDGSAVVNLQTFSGDVTVGPRK